MPRTSTILGKSHLVIDTGVATPGATTIVERKGLGHPDTLADHLAERLSRAYSRYTVDHFGAVLHHNFDKLALLGGASEVRYGGGRMTSPVRVLVNGRAAPMCGGESIPVTEIVEAEVRSFFAERLPEVSDSLDIVFNITSNSSPGAVLTGDEIPDRTRWFSPRSIDDLRERRVRLSNDTSLGTGWAPENSFESFVRELVDHFSGDSDFTRAHAWCGSDVKLMGYWDGECADVVLCVPQKSRQVGSRGQYVRNAETVLVECHRLAGVRLPGAEARFRLNARDVPDKDELYLTYTGSSIESGDEGVVGRGNRVNGLITPLRPMNLEGANGKNPVYHVGKLYNIAAQRLALRLHEATAGYAEVHLVSTTGQRLDEPWRILVRLSAADAELDKVQALVAEILTEFPALTDELVSGGIVLS
ncbi:methionine adenosyltransferase [Streptomyces sp. H10-C2]|uniref:methionine adenosyltransferase n=1 Tax=unclassified Streptomyces TaxID=2593676 RepID=UPI0024BAF00D|nr:MULTISPECIES: methionine adenosyltransferase [unclassified Streptomyces]MDJ0342627.1 methionine adenosyltransferase [Streptomyces sp. PH10-H1]MDJ0368519.1 methionine adenosyltransferase [Streptomyces sp. H10-C2]